MNDLSDDNRLRPDHPTMRAIQAHEELCRATGADACVVLRFGRVISETYWNGKSAEQPVSLMSSTKSITSLLFGMMVDRGLIGTDTPVGVLVPECDTGIRRGITLEHLLTHTCGLNKRQSQDGDRQSIGFVEDKSGFVRGLLPDREPGTSFAYSNEGVQLLGVAMHERLAQDGDSLVRFTERELFDPLGINGATFRRDPSGYPWTYANLQMKPTDLAKIGVMMSQGGNFEGSQIVSADWVARSTKKQVEVPASENLGPEFGCGYLWWTVDKLGGYASLGHLNTNMFVFPDSGLVVVRTQETPPETRYIPEAIELFSRMTDHRS